MIRTYELRADMDGLARTTWQKIVNGDEWGISFREDSLTDHNLWTMAECHPALQVRKYTQNAEAESGADWEWWIGSPTVRWVCLRIQAKRIYRRSYPQLTHGGNEEYFDNYQYDTLIRGCEDIPWLHPMHVFYNGWREGNFPPSRKVWPSAANWLACPNHDSPRECPDFAIDHYGCAITSSAEVKRIHEAHHRATNGQPRQLTRTVPPYLSSSLPWSYLFGGRVHGAAAVGGGPEELTPSDPEATMKWLITVLHVLAQPIVSREDLWTRLMTAETLPAATFHQSQRAQELPDYILDRSPTAVSVAPVVVVTNLAILEQGSVRQ